jgi:hypothetical protein
MYGHVRDLDTNRRFYEAALALPCHRVCSRGNTSACLRPGRTGAVAVRQQCRVRADG